MNAPTLVDLLDRCPVPLPLIAAKTVEIGAPVSVSSLQAYSTGRRFPTADAQGAIARALESLGSELDGLAAQVRQVERPAKPSAGKRGPGKRGRPKKSAAASPEPAATTSPPRSAAVRSSAPSGRPPVPKTFSARRGKRSKE